MSIKLDKSLDEIVSTTRRTRPSRTAAARPAARQQKAPSGGVQKNTRNSRGAAAPQPSNSKKAASKASTTPQTSKIIVSNLPRDVTEQQIKEYFGQSVGPIKRVELVYGANAMSRGIANVTFTRHDAAHKAFRILNGLLVDGRAIKIEIIVDASQAAAIAPPPPKSLAERTSQPKSAKPTKATSQKGGRQSTGPKEAKPKQQNNNSNRRSKKTVEELDTEMADYFVASEAAPAPAAAPVTDDDAIM